MKTCAYPGCTKPAAYTAAYDSAEWSQVCEKHWGFSYYPDYWQPLPASFETKTMIECKALSVRQPWAHLLVHGIKRIELRTWSVNYRGPLLICTGGRPRKGQRRDDILAPADAIEAGYAAPRGRLVGLVNLVDVRPATPADARAACCEPGPRDFAWVFDDDPLPIVDGPEVSGRLNLFTLDCAALSATVRVRIERALSSASPQ